MRVKANSNIFIILLFLFYIPLCEIFLHPKHFASNLFFLGTMEKPSPEMAAIFREIVAGKNILLFGAAGTGKSHFIQYVKRRLGKNVAVVAMTGSAAVNVGGKTIHSFFQIGDNFRENLANQRLRITAELRKNFSALDLLIIDEISTVRADLLDHIDRILRRARKSDRPFGGLQIVFCGDLHQLPPVIEAETAAALRSQYGREDPLFFDAKVFRQLTFSFFELRRIFRQQDPEFLRALQNIADGTEIDSALHHINGRVYAEADLPTDAIRITARHETENLHNEKNLASAPGKLFTYPAVLRGSFCNRPVKNLPAPKLVSLKKDAPVVFTKNGSLWQNGTLGKVVRLGPDRVTVKILHSGKNVTVERAVWKDVIYKNGRREVLGTMTQFSLKLAYAMTIHRAQGQTMDRVILDKSPGDSFTFGQVYTALSRVRNIEDLFLTAALTAEDVKINPRIHEFMEKCRQTEPNF